LLREFHAERGED